MERKKVFITCNIPEPGVELLTRYFEVNINDGEIPMPKDKLIEAASEADAVLCLLTDNIDKEVISRLERVKIFANYAVGYNNIDVDAASEKEIAVTNTPDVLTDATADLAWALIFAVARRIVESDRFTREGNFKVWQPKLFLGQDITGKTLGIIGAGRIGKALAKKSMGFDMQITYHNRTRNEELENKYNAKWVSLNTLLSDSDIISLYCPLTEETKHLIGEEQFNLMRNNAILINTSRGPVIAECALVKALRDNKIWGAGLDVYEREPEIEEELKALSNVVLVPHIGSATIETRNKMAIMAAENIIEVLQGKVPKNLVNSSIKELLK